MAKSRSRDKGKSKRAVLAKEEHFHDGWAEAIDVRDIDVKVAFEACTAPENRLIMKRLGRLKGKKILEVGCGAGEAAVYFATKGADVVATDISGGMLEVVRRLAKRNQTSLKTVKCYSHMTPFQEKTFDVVYAANLLHHVDIDKTLKEAKRVLKDGGLFISWDPLRHNPIINVYRRIATDVRTEDEHPIHMRDLKLFRKRFSSVEYYSTWLFTLWIFIKFYLTGVNPNKERYWKKILTEHRKLERTYSRLEALDRFFLKVFPFLRRYCWNIVIFARK